MNWRIMLIVIQAISEAIKEFLNGGGKKDGG